MTRSSDLGAGNLSARAAGNHRGETFASDHVIPGELTLESPWKFGPFPQKVQFLVPAFGQR